MDISNEDKLTRLVLKSSLSFAAARIIKAYSLVLNTLSMR
jgi:hypothetical protein